MSTQGNGQHIIVGGKTGKGKSFFTRILEHRFYMKGWNIVLIDIEDKIKSFASKNEPGTIIRPHRYDGTLNKKHRVTYYAPSLPGWKDETLEQLYDQCLHSEYLFVSHDEIVGLATASQHPDGLIYIYTRGRKIDVLGGICTQRPVDIPRTCVTQAGIVACFEITDDDDRAVMAKKMHQPLMNDDTAWLDQYGYWLYNDRTMKRAEYRKPLVVTMEMLRGVRVKKR